MSETKKDKIKIKTHIYTDGKERKRFKENCVPENFYLSPKKRREPKHWITDGQTEKLISADLEIPNGWRIGISDKRKNKISKTESGKHKSKHQKEARRLYYLKHKFHWYTDGIDDGRYLEGDQPQGWVRGQSIKHRRKNSESNKGKKMSIQSSIKRVETRRANNTYIVKPETRQKLREINLGRKQSQETISKRNKTKMLNNSFNKSYPQNLLQNLFLNIYPDARIEYNEDPRYPFCADIYIPRFDLFIEINAHWTHGEHPFDKNNPEDIRKLDRIKKNQKIYLDKNNLPKKNSYYIAEKVWCENDPLKLKYAKDNNLNYLVLYNVTNENIKLFEHYDIEKTVKGIKILYLNQKYNEHNVKNEYELYNNMDKFGGKK